MYTSKIRWVILLLLFIATGLSFLDRQVLSIVIIKIQKEFNFSDVEYGFINTFFLVGYAIMFTVSGRIIDVVGSKLGLAVSVGLWSIANCFHGVINNYNQLVVARFSLGVGEGGCFPGAAKTVNEWFDSKRRAFANGIAIGGSAIGAVIAPPLTIYLSNAYGWRWAFMIPGFVGIVWVLVWVMLPKNKVGEAIKLENPAAKIPFLSFFRNRDALVFIAIRFMLDPVIYFLMFWVPKYLNQERNVSFERIGQLFWVPFLALGISNIIGGWLSDKLISNNFTVNRARKIVMGIAATMTLSMPFIATVSTPERAVALMALFMFAHGFWITNYITSISDVFGDKGTATVVGLSGTAGATSSLIINPMIGVVVQNYTYAPLWVIAGFLYPLAFILFVVTIKIKK
ncbi:MFS transporter [soil metagenome]